MEKSLVDSALTSFFFSLIPDDLLAAYRKLVSLKYPISDKKSFAGQLKNPQASEDEKYANGILISVFETSSFPLNSEQNALEKFHSLLPPTLQIVPIEGDFNQPVHVDVLDPDVRRSIETRILPEHAPILRRLFTCSQRCEEAYNNCMKDVSVYDDVGKWRCEIARALCMNRCRRARAL